MNPQHRPWWLGLGVLAVALFLWDGDPAGDSARGKTGQAIQGQGVPKLLGPAATVSQLAVHIEAPGGSPVRWHLSAGTMSGWSAKMEGAGSNEVLLRDVPAELLFLVARPSDSSLLRTERLVDPAEHLESGVTLTLRPGGRIVGRVTDVGGEAVFGAWVEVTRNYARSRPAWAQALGVSESPATRVQTGADGTFEMGGLAVAVHTVQVRHFDYRPQVLLDVLVEAPGVEKRLDVVLERGIRFKGRVLDRDGGEFSRVAVHFLRESKPFTYSRDSWVRTAQDGVFVSPALAEAPSYLIKVQAVDQGGITVIEHRVEVPDSPPDLIEVGTLAPYATVVRLRLPDDRPERTYSLIASAFGDVAGRRTSLALANVAFDEAGKVSLAGLPPGVISWSVLEALPDGRDVSVGSGNLKVKQAEQDFLLTLDAPPDPSTYDTPPEVYAPRAGRSPVDVLLLREGAIVYKTTVRADGSRVDLPKKLKHGTYELIVRQGDNVGRAALPIPGEGSITLNADRRGRTIPIRVTRGDSELAGVEISVLGFDVVRGARGIRALKTQTDADGVARLAGMPPWSKHLMVVAVDAASGTGRVFVAALDKRAGIHIDLSGRTGPCCNAAHGK